MYKKMRKYIIACLLLLAFLTGCSKEYATVDEDTKNETALLSHHGCF